MPIENWKPHWCLLWKIKVLQPTVALWADTQHALEALQQLHMRFQICRSGKCWDRQRNCEIYWPSLFNSPMQNEKVRSTVTANMVIRKCDLDLGLHAWRIFVPLISGIPGNGAFGIQWDPGWVAETMPGNVIYLGLSPCPGCSHHQDCYVFSRGSQPKPSFATGILGGGLPPNIYIRLLKLCDSPFVWLLSWKDWKKEHAFGYVKAPGGKLKTQQAPRSLKLLVQEFQYQKTGCEFWLLRLDFEPPWNRLWDHLLHEVIEAINTFLEKKKEKDVIVATGVGNHQMMSCQFIRWTKLDTERRTAPIMSAWWCWHHVGEPYRMMIWTIWTHNDWTPKKWQSLWIFVAWNKATDLHYKWKLGSDGSRFAFCHRCPGKCFLGELVSRKNVWTIHFWMVFYKFWAFFCCQVANPDALTILIDGDGSFGMTNMDLQTVKRWDLLLKQRSVQRVQLGVVFFCCLEGINFLSRWLWWTITGRHLVQLKVQLLQWELQHLSEIQAANGMDLAATLLRGPLHKCILPTTSASETFVMGQFIHFIQVLFQFQNAPGNQWQSWLCGSFKGSLFVLAILEACSCQSGRQAYGIKALHCDNETDLPKAKITVKVFQNYSFPLFA